MPETFSTPFQNSRLLFEILQLAAPPPTSHRHGRKVKARKGVTILMKPEPSPPPRLPQPQLLSLCLHSFHFPSFIPLPFIHSFHFPSFIPLPFIHSFHFIHSTSLHSFHFPPPSAPTPFQNFENSRRKGTWAESLRTLRETFLTNPPPPELSRAAGEGEGGKREGRGGNGGGSIPGVSGGTGKKSPFRTFERGGVSPSAVRTFE